MKRRSILGYLGIFLVLGLGRAGSVVGAEGSQSEWVVRRGVVRFLAVGKPSAIRIKGTSEKLHGRIAMQGSDLKGEFEIPVDSLDTGIALRTDHMKERYLEVKKFPRAVLSLSNVTLPTPLTAEGCKGEDIPIAGLLNLHGVQRPISLVASFQCKGEAVRASVRFPISVTQHEIEVPKYLGITVADQVEVEADLELKRN